jgi:Asp-tRNA(Asn)/Glu-tRNA(Gln) amidotransferase A subunit family amidase
VTEADIAFLSIAELGAKLRSKAVSPVELATHFLDRLEKHGPGLGALVTLTRERALAEAREAEKELRSGKVRGPLHGIPYGLKDLVATKGIPTTWGAEPYRNQVFDFDATACTNLREAGAVLVAKLSMVELAGGLGYNNADASFTGPGRTPWNRDFWSGGSSSGGAWPPGSCPPSARSRARSSRPAFCGAPARRLVSRHGAMPLAFTLDKLGPMARSAADCALVLAVIAGKDPKDPQTAGRSFAPEAPRTRYRVGLLKGTFEKAQPEVAAAFQESLKVLARSATWCPTSSCRTCRTAGRRHARMLRRGDLPGADQRESTSQGRERQVGRLRAVDDAGRRLHRRSAPRPASRECGRARGEVRRARGRRARFVPDGWTSTRRTRASAAGRAIAAGTIAGCRRSRFRTGSPERSAHGPVSGWRLPRRTAPRARRATNPLDFPQEAAAF